jgi:hypothetical protein
MIHQELSGKITRMLSGWKCLTELKPGLDEKLYEHAMTAELKHRGHSVSVQCCVRKNLVRPPPDPILIFMPESSYPCYPCNSWLMP